MNWVDLAAAAVIVISGLVGLVRGMVREVLGVGAWIGAALVALYTHPYAEPIATRNISDPGIAAVAAYAGPFVAALVVLWVASRVVSGFVRDSVLGGLDRTLGLVFGFARGAILLAVLYILFGTVQPVDKWPAPVLEARSLPAIHSLAAWTASQVPPEYRPQVAHPPADRATDAQAWMQRPPVTAARSPVVPPPASP